MATGSPTYLAVLTQEVCVRVKYWSPGSPATFSATPSLPFPNGVIASFYKWLMAHYNDWELSLQNCSSTPRQVTKGKFNSCEMPPELSCDYCLTRFSWSAWFSCVLIESALLVYTQFSLGFRLPFVWLGWVQDGAARTFHLEGSNLSPTIPLSPQQALHFLR